MGISFKTFRSAASAAATAGFNALTHKPTQRKGNRAQVHPEGPVLAGRPKLEGDAAGENRPMRSFAPLDAAASKAWDEGMAALKESIDRRKDADDIKTAGKAHDAEVAARDARFGSHTVWTRKPGQQTAFEQVADNHRAGSVWQARQPVTKEVPVGAKELEDEAAYHGFERPDYGRTRTVVDHKATTERDATRAEADAGAAAHRADRTAAKELAAERRKFVEYPKPPREKDFTRLATDDDHRKEIDHARSEGRRPELTTSVHDEEAFAQALSAYKNNVRVLDKRADRMMKMSPQAQSEFFAAKEKTGLNDGFEKLMPDIKANMTGSPNKLADIALRLTKGTSFEKEAQALFGQGNLGNLMQQRLGIMGRAITVEKRGYHLHDFLSSHGHAAMDFLIHGDTKAFDDVKMPKMAPRAPSGDKPTKRIGVSWQDEQGTLAKGMNQLLSRHSPEAVLASSDKEVLSRFANRALRATYGTALQPSAMELLAQPDAGSVLQGRLKVLADKVEKNGDQLEDVFRQQPGAVMRFLLDERRFAEAGASARPASNAEANEAPARSRPAAPAPAAKPKSAVRQREPQPSAASPRPRWEVAAERRDAQWLGLSEGMTRRLPQDTREKLVDRKVAALNEQMAERTGTLLSKISVDSILQSNNAQHLEGLTLHLVQGTKFEARAQELAADGTLGHRIKGQLPLLAEQAKKKGVDLEALLTKNPVAAMEFLIELDYRRLPSALNALKPAGASAPTTAA